MAGLLSGFQTTAPQPTMVPLDQTTNDLINQQSQYASQAPQQFAQQQDQGVAQQAAQAQQSGAQASQQDATQGYSQGAVNGALRNQYNAQAGSRVQQIQNAYNQNAVFQKNAAVQQSFNESMARQNVTTQSYSELMKAYNATETARAQVLQSILGAGGMMAGAAMAKRRSGNGAPNFGGGMPSAGDPTMDASNKS